jgi:adenylate cyclase
MRQTRPAHGRVPAAACAGLDARAGRGGPWSPCNGWTTSSTTPGCGHHARGLDERVVIVDIDEKAWPKWAAGPGRATGWRRLVDDLFERPGHPPCWVWTPCLPSPTTAPACASCSSSPAGRWPTSPARRSACSNCNPSWTGRPPARALKGRPVVLGYYFTSDRDGRTSGVLPAPVMHPKPAGPSAAGHPLGRLRRQHAPWPKRPPGRLFQRHHRQRRCGALPALLAEHQGRYYESLSLAMFRLLGCPGCNPAGSALTAAAQVPQALPTTVHGCVCCARTAARLIDMDERVAVLVPFRGPGGRAVRSATSRPPTCWPAVCPRPAARGKIVLLGTTAPGLLDLRATPMAETYPGVETHANLIAGLLDGACRSNPTTRPGSNWFRCCWRACCWPWRCPCSAARGAVLLSAGRGGRSA